MRQWTGSALVQIMACRLFGTKPLPEPLLASCKLHRPGNKFSEILIKIQNFSVTKKHLKISSAKWRLFCPGVDGTNTNSYPCQMWWNLQGRDGLWLHRRNLNIVKFRHKNVPCCNTHSRRCRGSDQAQDDMLERMFEKLYTYFNPKQSLSFSWVVCHFLESSPIIFCYHIL